MNENLDPTDDHFSAEEHDIEKVLRPLSFDDFAGQDQVLENLQIFVEAAVARVCGYTRHKSYGYEEK